MDQKRKDGDKSTFEHILTLSIEDTCSHLQILSFEEVCDGECCRVWRTRIDGLLLLLLLLLDLGLLLLGSCLLCNSLLFQLLNELRDGHASFLSIGSELSLHGLDLFWSWLLSGLQSGLGAMGLKAVLLLLRCHLGYAGEMLMEVLNISIFVLHSRLICSELKFAPHRLWLVHRLFVEQRS
jgi:hypothetical protein